MDYNEFCLNTLNLLNYFGKYYNQCLQDSSSSSIVRATSSVPGDLFKKLELYEKIYFSPIDKKFEHVMELFFALVFPHLTHWQHVNFLSYFPCGYSFESIIGELLTAILGVNSFSWLSCPASTELEMHVINYLAEMFALPKQFKFNEYGGSSSGGGGVILCSASESMCVVVNSVIQNFLSKNNDNLDDFSILTSSQAHCCVDKIAKMLRVRLVKIETFASNYFSLTLDDIENFLNKNKKTKTLMVICTIGTTLTCAVDEINKIAEYCCQNNIYIHVDASYMGAMFLIDEFRQKFNFENVDSININISKWMRVNLDAACLWVKNSNKIVESLDVSGPYLSLDDTYTSIPNYRNWSLSFSRRFRSLKIWFVLKGIGFNKLKEHIVNQISIASQIKLDLSDRFKNNIEFLSMQYNSGLICFRIFKSCLYTKYLAKLLRSNYSMFIQTVEIDKKHYIRMCINSNYLTLYNYKKNISDKLIECIVNIQNYVKPSYYGSLSSFND